MNRIISLKLLALFALVLLCFIGSGAGVWAASGSLGGSAQPIPNETTPYLGQDYLVTLQLSNLSFSNEPGNGGTGISVNVNSASLTLACADSNCNTQLGGTVTFVNPGGNGCVVNDPCVTSCSASGNNSVVLTLNNCSIGPNQFLNLAVVRVRQDATPNSFIMRGQATYQGIAGTCTGGFCDNAEENQHTCTNNTNCNFSILSANATGTANLSPEFCGNGKTELGEECDDANTNNNDSCRNDCTLPNCGDGIVDLGEQCDDGGDTDRCDGCASDCTIPSCGDGIMECGEQCDDGDTNNGDGCSSTCTIESYCGDGNIDPGEECDDGGDADRCDGCASDCTIPSCGDGIMECGEQCDDGDTNNGDGCSSTCTIEPYCGDGNIDPGEECDDGNNTNGDGCSDACMIEEGGGEGCTPGYWKQPHHFGNWSSPYTPETLFSDVFEDAFPDMTLLDVLSQGGGGLIALGRHTVAALLNAASPGVDYDLSTNDVIEMFNNVYPDGRISTVKDTFEGYNERECLLGRAERQSDISGSSTLRPIRR